MGTALRLAGDSQSYATGHLLIYSGSGNIEAVKGNISGSATSTGSFTHVNATTYVGDISQLTGTAVAGTISSSAQIASYISGSHTSGFEFTGTIGTRLGTWAAGAAKTLVWENGGGTGMQNAALVFGPKIPSTDKPASL